MRRTSIGLLVALMSLVACKNTATTFSELLPLDDEQPTLVFFYTDN
ncbi:MAG: hypothetical protein H6673_02785 [Anaerolineales bacterium]|nr:hypothetical protein [Anaerolineales bacterium]